MLGRVVLLWGLLSAGCGTVGEAVYYGSLAAVTSLPKLAEGDRPPVTPPPVRCNGSYCSMIEDCVGVLWFAHCEVSERVRLELLENTKAPVRRKPPDFRFGPN